MSKQYQADNPLQANNSQRLLIGVPLVITLVFCFGFVAMNPNKKDTSISASAKDDTSKESKPTPLPPLPTSVVAEQTLSTEEPAATSSSSSAVSDPDSSSNAGSTPQAAPVASSPNTSSPQSSASTARTTITSKMNVTVTNGLKKALGR